MCDEYTRQKFPLMIDERFLCGRRPALFHIINFYCSHRVFFRSVFFVVNPIHCHFYHYSLFAPFPAILANLDMVVAYTCSARVG